ncbi:MAG: MFS transporter [Desulfobacterales bacterium]|nr:MFS transporter [Desulfobacterales bacterium]
MEAYENEYDRPITIFSAILILIAGNAVFAGLPMILGVLIDVYGYTEQHAGWIASSSLGGSCVAGFLVMILASKVNRKKTMFVGLVMMLLGNLLAAWTTDLIPALLVWFFAGIGKGFCFALGMVIIAGTSNTPRNFGFQYFAIVLFIGLELFFIPTITDAWGYSGIFYVFSAIGLICIPFVTFIPEKYKQSEEEKKQIEGKSYTLPAILGLAAVLIFYAGIGAFWAYIEVIGGNIGLSYEAIGNYLTIGNFLSLTSCLVASWIGDRLGMYRPLTFVLIANTIILSVMGFSMTTFAYIIGIMLFFMFWNVTDIFQAGTISNYDQSGRYTALIPAVMGIGLTIGPAVASFVVIGENGSSTVLYLCAGTCLATFAIYLGIKLKWGSKAIDIKEG